MGVENSQSQSKRLIRSLIAVKILSKALFFLKTDFHLLYIPKIYQYKTNKKMILGFL